MLVPDKCEPTGKVHFIFRSVSTTTKKQVAHYWKNLPSASNLWDKETLDKATRKTVPDHQAQKPDD